MYIFKFKIYLFLGLLYLINKNSIEKRKMSSKRKFVDMNSENEDDSEDEEEHKQKRARIEIETALQKYANETSGGHINGYVVLAEIAFVVWYDNESGLYMIIPNGVAAVNNSIRFSKFLECLLTKGIRCAFKKLAEALNCQYGHYKEIVAALNDKNTIGTQADLQDIGGYNVATIKKVMIVYDQMVSDAAAQVTHDADQVTHDADQVTHNADQVTHNADQVTHDADQVTHDADQVTHDADRVAHDA